MKEFLLAKIYNGYVKTNFCPPLNRLYYLPRAETLSEIISRYPKEKKQKEKFERKLEIDGIWFKTLIHIVTYDEEEEKENRSPQFKDALVQVLQDTIRVIDPKSLLPMYTWDINLLYQWKMPNPKTLIAYFGFQVELSEAVVFKSLDVKKIVSLITSYTTNTPFFGYDLKHIEKLFERPRYFTREELKQYDGSDPELPVYLAIKGTVFDVTPGRRHYGKGGAYSHFAGKDASRSFVTGCFTDECYKADIEKGLEGLSDKDMETVNGWYKFYNEHKDYKAIGFVRN